MGTDMNQAEIDVRKNIDLIRDYLPDRATDPTTFAFDPSMQPIMFIALSSDQLGMPNKDVGNRADRATPGAYHRRSFGQYCRGNGTSD
jgi:multidrug efflux pump subunit AcrB